MTDAEIIETISVEKALEHSTMRAIVRDFSPDKHNMMILAEEVKRLRRVLANEVKHHVAKIDTLKAAESRERAMRTELRTDLLTIEASSRLLCKIIDEKKIPDSQIRIRLSMNEKALEHIRAALSPEPKIDGTKTKGE